MVFIVQNCEQWTVLHSWSCSHSRHLSWSNALCVPRQRIQKTFDLVWKKMTHSLHIESNEYKTKTQNTISFINDLLNIFDIRRAFVCLKCNMAFVCHLSYASNVQSGCLNKTTFVRTCMVWSVLWIDRIICLLCVYICHYIFPFYYLTIYYYYLKKKKKIIVRQKALKHTRDRLFGKVLCYVNCLM
jgi:hypothetical protein